MDTLSLKTLTTEQVQELKTKKQAVLNKKVSLENLKTDQRFNDMIMDYSDFNKTIKQTINHSEHIAKNLINDHITGVRNFMKYMEKIEMEGSIAEQELQEITDFEKTEMPVKK